MLFLYLFQQIIKDLGFNKIITSVVLLSLVFAVTPFLILLSIVLQGESMIIQDFAKGFSLNTLKVSSSKPLPRLMNQADRFFVKSVAEPFRKEVQVRTSLSTMKSEAFYVGRRYFNFYGISAR